MVTFQPVVECRKQQTCLNFAKWVGKLACGCPFAIPAVGRDKLAPRRMRCRTHPNPLPGSK